VGLRAHGGDVADGGVIGLEVAVVRFVSPFISERTLPDRHRRALRPGRSSTSRRRRCLPGRQRNLRPLTSGRVHFSDPRRSSPGHRPRSDARRRGRHTRAQPVSGVVNGSVAPRVSDAISSREATAAARTVRPSLDGHRRDGHRAATSEADWTASTRLPRPSTSHVIVGVEVLLDCLADVLGSFPAATTFPQRVLAGGPGSCGRLCPRPRPFHPRGCGAPSSSRVRSPSTMAIPSSPVTSPGSSTRLRPALHQPAMLLPRRASTCRRSLHTVRLREHLPPCRPSVTATSSL